MKKDTAVIFITTMLITATIIGGVYYMAVIKSTAQPPDPTKATWQTIKPNDSQPTGNANVSAETSSRRTNTPIKCHNPEIGEFWTNAASCGEADLHNRLSEAESITPPSQQNPYGNENYVPPEEEAARNQGKSQRD